MPIFEYRCTDCGHDFEKLIYASTEVQCPECDSKTVTKKLSLFGMSGVDNPFAGTSSANCGSCAKSSCTSCS